MLEPEAGARQKPRPGSIGANTVGGRINQTGGTPSAWRWGDGRLESTDQLSTAGEPEAGDTQPYRQSELVRSPSFPRCDFQSHSIIWKLVAHAVAGPPVPELHAYL